MADNPVAPVVGTLVPGIGDEVVAGIVFLLGTVLAVGIAYIVRSLAHNSIHPDQVCTCVRAPIWAYTQR